MIKTEMIKIGYINIIPIQTESYTILIICEPIPGTNCKLAVLCTCLWLYETVKNRKKVYSKIKFEEIYGKIKFWENPWKSRKMEISPDNVIKNDTDQKPR